MGLSLVVGLVGTVAALVLPFAPVLADQTTLSWPAPGRPTVSSTALLTPYRPAELTAEVPCAVIRAAEALGRPTTVLSTGGATDSGAGLLVRADAGATQVLVNGTLVDATRLDGTRLDGTRLDGTRLDEADTGVRTGRATGPDCGVRVRADRAGVTVTAAGATRTLAGEPVPEIAAFRTDLDPDQASGLTVTVRPATPFQSTPSPVKRTVIAVVLVAAVAALALLGRAAAVRRPRWSRPRPGVRWLVDVGVLGTLAGWAVIGPLSDDDGFATMIARNSELAGDQGNYYRWWNASETPFQLSYQLIAVMDEVSLAPLWLRLPSTVLGVATWLLLSRGLLGAVPELGSGRARVRLLAGACFLAAWLPYNLGVRVEPMVAFELTALLVVLWRARSTAGLAVGALITAAAVATSPSGLLMLAPIAVFAGKIGRILRGGGRAGGWEMAARVLLLGAVGGVGSVLIFADQAGEALLVATRWHTEFGPSLPWSAEFSRYQFLLGADQDGNAAKRVPVLLTLALLPVLGVLLARRGRITPLDTTAARLAGVAAVGLALLWLTPSKWSHHFGSLAGVIAAVLVIAVLVLRAHARDQPAHRPLDRVLLGTGLGGIGLVALAAALSFAGPNDWWQPTVYAVPWADGPVRPFGLPLDAPPLWFGMALAFAALVRLGSGVLAARAAVVAAPGALAAAVAGVSVAVMLFSFGTAPLRQPEGSLALNNLDRLRGETDCGLADDVQVLPDTPGGVLMPATPVGVTDPDGGDQPVGFATGAGWDPAHPPPDPPGVGASARLWGSRADGPVGTGRLVSEWFTLPALRADQELAMTVSGRTDGGNLLALEFGASTGSAVTELGERVPVDRPHTDPRAKPDPAFWRSVWLEPTEIPRGADRVRVRAVDASSDFDGWLALTGPRLREVVPLTDFLAANGPVLVNWPIAFLFPCVTNEVGVAHGVADAPRVIVDAPGRYAGLAAVITEPNAGGNLAALRTLGTRGEVPTRLVGHPEVDWGSVRFVGYPGLERDTYQLTVTDPTGRPLPR